jgi:Protein of unknown function (DUF3110).
MSIYLVFITIILAFVTDAFAPMNTKCSVAKKGSIHKNDSRLTIFSSAGTDGDGDDDNDISDFLDEQINSNPPQLRDLFPFNVDNDVKPDNVHIILFNPNTDREGVHTLEFPKGSGTNIILAFECEEECQQFSDALRDQKFYNPIPQQVELESLENYCGEIGVDVQVVPKGVTIRPPKENVLNLGLNPNLLEEMNMLDYLFHISSDDSGIDEGKDETNSTGGNGAWE